MLSENFAVLGVGRLFGPVTVAWFLAIGGAACVPRGITDGLGCLVVYDLDERRVTAAVADEPLPARDDLQRAITAFVELDRMHDRPRLPDQITGLPQEPDHLGTGSIDGQTGEQHESDGLSG